MLTSNYDNRSMFNSGHARRVNTPESSGNPCQVGDWPAARPLRSCWFDSRRPGIRFQVEAAPLGRGVARDAAGRAGSLRGPRRVFLCADRPPIGPEKLPDQQKLFNRYLA
jgi:hypothetical protein